MKHFRGWYSNGITFGMDIEASTSAYRALKKNVTRKRIAVEHGFVKNVLICPSKYVAGVMREAGWIVSEMQSFKKIQIDEGKCIYVEYPDGFHI